MSALFVWFLARTLVQREWLGLFGFGIDSAAFVVLLRFGLVGYIGGFVSHTILRSFPLTTYLSAFYAGTGLAAVLVVIGIAVGAFVISVGGRPLFGRMALED